MEDFKNIFDEQPDKRLWDRLEDKLDRKKYSLKLRFYRIASVAAMFIALIAAVAYFNHILDDHNPHLFASNEGFTSFVLEELENEEKGLFNMNGFKEIREAYFNYSEEEEENFILAGEYIAKDGEINIEIGLTNYIYILEFNYDGLPKLELKEVKGQTLYFESESGHKLKMNIEPYGLKLVESSFLPEYKNYQFKKLKTI